MFEKFIRRQLNELKDIKDTEALTKTGRTIIS